MKWVGGFLCFLTSVGVGFLAGRNEEERTEQCEAFLALFVHIQNQVSYFLAPTKLMYKNFKNTVLERTGFLRALAEHETDEVYFDVWEDALAASKPNLRLTEAQYEIVRAFGSCIGKSNEDLQIKHLEYYAKAMRTECEKQKSEMKKNIKMYRTMGFAIGAAIFIVVI